jgi:hypothetical protein
MQLHELEWDDSTYPAQRWTWQVGGTRINIVQQDDNRYTLFDNSRRAGARTWWNVDALTLQCLLYELLGE